MTKKLFFSKICDLKYWSDQLFKFITDFIQHLIYFGFLLFNKAFKLIFYFLYRIRITIFYLPKYVLVLFIKKFIYNKRL